MFQSVIRIIPLILISTLLISCKSQVVSGPSWIEEPSVPGNVDTGSNTPSESSITLPPLVQQKVTLVKPQRVMQVAAVSEPVNLSYKGCIE